MRLAIIIFFIFCLPVYAGYKKRMTIEQTFSPNRTDIKTIEQSTANIKTFHVNRHMKVAGTIEPDQNIRVFVMTSNHRNTIQKPENNMKEFIVPPRKILTIEESCKIDFSMLIEYLIKINQIPLERAKDNIGKMNCFSR